MNIRKAHVKRFFSEDKSSFVDVLRLDEIELTSAAIDGVRGQKQILTLLWEDGGNKEAGEAYRGYDQITIFPQNFGEFILGQEIVLNRIASTILDLNGQRIYWTFNNSEAGTRDFTEIGIPTLKEEKPFEGIKEWDAYKKYMATHGLPSDYGVGINIRLINITEQINSGQRSFMQFNQEDVVKYIGSGEANFFEAPYMLDPFQIIVNACWESTLEEFVSLTVGMTWWGEEAIDIGCAGDELHEHLVMEDASDLGPYAWHSYNFFSTRGALKPSLDHLAGPDGVCDVGGQLPGPGCDYEYSGVPEMGVTISTPPMKVAWLNQDLWYGQTDPFVGEWNVLSRIYVEGMTASFALRAQNTIFSTWCEAGYYPPLTRRKQQDLDVRALQTHGGRDTAYRDQYSYEIYRKTVDFSSVRVRRKADGKLYVADSVVGPFVDDYNPWWVTVVMKAVKDRE